MKNPTSTPAFLFRLSFALPVAAFLAQSPLKGASLANFEFSGGSLVSSVADPSQYTLTNAGRGPGYSVTATGDATNNVFRIGGDSGSATTFEAAVLNGEYVSFKITPGVGLGVQLESLTFSQAFVSGGGAGAGNFNLGIALYTSADAFAAAVPGGSFTNNVTLSLAATPRSIDLSALGTITAETEFRLYVFDNSGATNRAHRIDDIVLNGTVVSVPEPSVTLSLGLAALCLAGRRRRTA